MRGSTV